MGSSQSFSNNTTSSTDQQRAPATEKEEECTDDGFQRFQQEQRDPEEKVQGGDANDENNRPIVTPEPTLSEISGDSDKDNGAPVTTMPLPEEKELWRMRDREDEGRYGEFTEFFACKTRQEEPKPTSLQHCIFGANLNANDVLDKSYLSTERRVSATTKSSVQPGRSGSERSVVATSVGDGNSKDTTIEEEDKTRSSSNPTKTTTAILPWISSDFLLISVSSSSSLPDRPGCDFELNVIYGCWRVLPDAELQRLKKADLDHQPPKLFLTRMPRSEFQESLKAQGLSYDQDFLKKLDGGVDARFVSFGAFPTNSCKTVTTSTTTTSGGGGAPEQPPGRNNNDAILDVTIKLYDPSSTPYNTPDYYSSSSKEFRIPLREISRSTLSGSVDELYAKALVEPLRGKASRQRVTAASAQKPEMIQEEIFNRYLRKMGLPQNFWLRESQALLEQRLRRVVVSVVREDNEENQDQRLFLPIELCQLIAFFAYGANDPRESR